MGDGRYPNMGPRILDRPYEATLFSLENRVILITGGYGLLGQQFAAALAKAGAKVVISGRDVAKAEKAAAEIEGWSVKLDVTRKACVETAIKKIVDRFGTIDGLINNASYSSPVDQKDEHFEPFEDLSEEAWKRSMDVDVTGMFLCAQAVGKVMLAQRGGSVVNVSSIYGNTSPDQRIYRGVTDHSGRSFIKPASYCTAKGAVLSLTRYLATYWGRKNIRVNTLTHGGVYDAQDASFVEAYKERTPLARMAQPHEYNGAILFLMSDASSYMTGANLIVDGGWTAW